MSFEWRKDEEEGWEEQVPVLVVVERPSIPYRFYFAICAVVFVAGGLVYWQLTRRAEAAATDLTVQVQASVALWQQAIAAMDVELFDSLLSRRERGWARTQQQLLATEQFWSRRLWGWEWQATADAPAHITLSPNLRQAQVVLPQTYVVKTAEGVTRTVVLSQTAVFRLDDERWRLAAAVTEFWGEEQSIEGENLLLTFPARDRAIVLELVEELEVALQFTCFQATGQPCQPQLQLPLHFVTDPATLYDMRFPTEYPAIGPINLPAPTLFGMPQEEEGQRLLTQNYIARLVPPVLPTVLGWQGERPIFYNTLIAHLLTEWDLRSPSLTPSLYESLLNSPVSLQEMSLVWASPDFAQMASVEHIQALIAFLVARGETAVSLQNSLAIPNFWQWANLLPNDPADEQAWLQFLYDHSTSASQPPPVPLPDLDVHLVCEGDQLYRYAGLAWQAEMAPFAGQSFIEIVPHHEGLLIWGRYFEEAAKDYRGQAFWVRGEQTILFSEWRTNTDAPLLSSQHYDPAGRKLVLQENALADGRLMQYWLLDVDSCGKEACSLLSLPGWPVWSADGRSTLIMQTNLSNLPIPQQTQLWRGEANGQIVAELEQGYAPFWLNEERYGYVRLNNSGRSELVTASVHGDASNVLLTIDELFGQLPGPDNPFLPFIANVQVNPVDANYLLVTALAPEVERTFLFAVMLEADRPNEIVRLFEEKGSLVGKFAPNGRYLVIDRALPEIGLRALTVNATEDHQLQNYFIIPYSNRAISYDWTADSQWLLLNYPGFLKLIAPGHPYQQIIPHPYGSCDRVEWVQ